MIAHHGQSCVFYASSTSGLAIRVQRRFLGLCPRFQHELRGPLGNPVLQYGCWRHELRMRWRKVSARLLMFFLSSHSVLDGTHSHTASHVVTSLILHRSSTTVAVVCWFAETEKRLILRHTVLEMTTFVTQQYSAADQVNRELTIRQLQSEAGDQWTAAARDLRRSSPSETTERGSTQQSECQGVQEKESPARS